MKLLERFFPKKYDAHWLLKTLTHEILTVLDLRDLMEVSVTNLVRIMKLESAGILFRNNYSKE